MRPIGRVLVANRGEIAVRLIQACQSLGIETVIAVSDVDRASLPSNRVEAIERMKRALTGLVISGVDTTIPFHLQLLHHPDYLQGQVNTRWIEQVLIRSQGTSA